MVKTDKLVLALQTLHYTSHKIAKQLLLQLQPTNKFDLVHPFWEQPLICIYLNEFFVQLQLVRIVRILRAEV